jgi:hypothetical protein
LPQSAANAAHVSYANATSKRVNDWAHPIATGRANDEYQVGDVLLGGSAARGQKDFKNKFESSNGRDIFINSNCIYTIQDMSNPLKIKISTDDDRILYVEKKYLSLSFGRTHACTCHSSQGLTLGETVYIHDYGVPMHADTPADRWHFTAITRCSTMNVVFVQNW